MPILIQCFGFGENAWKPPWAGPRDTNVRPSTIILLDFILLDYRSVDLASASGASIVDVLREIATQSKLNGQALFPRSRAVRGAWEPR